MELSRSKPLVSLNASPDFSLFDHVTHLLCLPQLSVKGYSDKQNILLKKIIEKMATFEIDEKRFNIIKEAVSSGPAARPPTSLNAVCRAVSLYF